MPCAAHAARSRAASPTAGGAAAPPGGRPRATRARPTARARRVPEREGPRPARAAVGVDDGEVGGGDAGEGAACSRVRDGGRAADDRGGGAVAGAEAAEAAEDEGDVRAEDAAVGVALVDGDHLEVGQHVGPLAGASDSGVEDVGIGEEGGHRAAAAAGRPSASPSKAAARRWARRANAPSELVVCEGLGREEKERARARVGAHRRHERQHVGERLAEAVAVHTQTWRRRAPPRAPPPGARRAARSARGAPPRPARSSAAAPSSTVRWPRRRPRTRELSRHHGCAASQPQSVAAVTASPSLRRRRRRRRRGGGRRGGGRCRRWRRRAQWRRRRVARAVLGGEASDARAEGAVSAASSPGTSLILRAAANGARCRRC